MKMDPNQSARSKQMRMVAIVIAATVMIWLAANWAGGKFGWPAEYAFLADMAAIGAFVWSLVVTWRIWRQTTPSGR